MKTTVFEKKAGFNIKEIKRLLRLFRALRKACRAKPPKKDEALVDIAHREAEEEFKKELEQGAKTLSSRIGRPHKTSKIEQKKLQEQCNQIVQKKEERIYREHGTKYDMKIKQQEEKVEKLVARIDYVITPTSSEFEEITEAERTLLVADWKDLRNKFFTSEIMRFNEQGIFDRTISALEIIKQRLVRKRRGKLFTKIGHGFLKLYEITIGQIFEFIYKHLQRS